MSYPILNAPVLGGRGEGGELGGVQQGYNHVSGSKRQAVVGSFLTFFIVDSNTFIVAGGGESSHVTKSAILYYDAILSSKALGMLQWKNMNKNKNKNKWLRTPLKWLTNRNDSTVV